MTLIKTLLRTVLFVKNIVVEKVNIHHSERTPELLVYARPYKNQAHNCPFCGRSCKAYDKGSMRRWRATNIGPFKVFIQYQPPRITCPEHGVVVASVPWAYHHSRFTKIFDMQVAWAAREMSQEAVSTLYQIDWKTVGRCIDRVSQDLGILDRSRFDNLVDIGIDETSYKKGHKYVTVVVNHQISSIVWMGEGHGESVLNQFFEKLTEKQRQSIKHVTADGARWIDASLQKYIPHAVRCIDPFHVVQWLNNMVDEMRIRAWNQTRREVQQKEKEYSKAKESLSTERRQKYRVAIRRKKQRAKVVKGTKLTLCRAERKLTNYQQLRLKLLLIEHPALNEAHNLKEQLRTILQETDLDVVIQLLQRWLTQAKESSYEKIQRIGEKIQRHQKNIVNTIRFNLSNARIEALNNKIKLLIRRAFGFASYQNLEKMVMLYCSNVKIPVGVDLYRFFSHRYA